MYRQGIFYLIICIISCINLIIYIRFLKTLHALCRRTILATTNKNKQI